MGKKGYNWKARQVVNTEIEQSGNAKVKVEFSTNGLNKYDECNSLVLPSKKRITHKKKGCGTVITKILSKKQRKKLEKIVEKKKKKENRSSILEALSKVQAPEDLLNQLTSVSLLQTKGLKRHLNEEERSINSIAGSKKKRLLLLQKETACDKSQTIQDPNVVGFESSSDCETDSSENESEHNDKIDNTEIANNESDSEIKDSLNEVRNSVEVNDCPQVQPNGPLESFVEQEITIKHSKESPRKAKEIEKKPSIPAVFVSVTRDASIQEGRLKLPILGEEQTVMEAIKENPVVLIAGETGSGKTTQVPQFLYEAGFASDGKMIGVTEPRRVAAISMSKRVGQELNMTEDKVSYLIRFEGNVTSSTQIKFMTDGVLLKELQTDFMLTKYSVIILDEAHERSMYTDILIGLLSRIVPLRNKRGNPLKLIIMSATLRLSDFTENTRLFKSPPPVIKVDSRQFPVTIHFNKQTPKDYLKEAYRKACKIHSQLPDGGILIFLTGQQEVNILVKKLRAAFPLKSKKQRNFNKNSTEMDNEDLIDQNLTEAIKRVKKTRKTQASAPALPSINLDNYQLIPEDDTEGDLLDLDSEEEWDEAEAEAQTTSQPLWVLPLFSLLPSHKQAQVFKPPPAGCRLCVVSTNVAETSLTIPQVKYVVDCGKAKTRLYDKHTGVSAFHVTWASKAAANQRAGRAGRTSAGHCYRLYSSAVFNDEFAEWSPPEMQRRPVDELLLQMKALGIDRVVNFPFPSPPDATQLQTAERRLTLLGALEPPRTKLKKDDWSSKLTALGQSMSVFPVVPRFAKMLCLSHQAGLLAYTVAVVAALSVQELLLIGDKRWLALRRQWAGIANSLQLGDVMVLLRAVGAGEYASSTGELERFCEENGLRHKGLVETRKLRLQLTSQLNLQLPGLELVVDPKMIPPTDTQARQLRQVVLAGMVDQVARRLCDDELVAREIRKGKPVYHTTDMEEVVHLSAHSALYKKAPDWIVYQEVFQTDKMYFRGVTGIEPEWLPLFAPSLCNLSTPLSEPSPRYNPDTGTPYCHFSGTFGKRGWTLPIVEMEFPEGLERYKWFAVFILEGSVCPKLKQYTKSLLSTPHTMIKSWASLQPRTETFLKTLVSQEVDSREKLLNRWKQDKLYLLSAYQSWLPESAHNKVAVIWPPI